MNKILLKLLICRTNKKLRVFALGRCADDKPFVPVYQVSKEKIRSIGIELIPLETSVKETIESLKEKGFVSFDSSNL